MFSNLLVSAPKWTVLTSSLAEMMTWKLFLSLPIILVCCVPLEKAMSTLALMQFIVFSCAASGIGVWILTFFVRSSHGIGGVMGLVIPLAMGFRHALPYQDVVNLAKFIPIKFHGYLPGRGNIQARHVPFLCLVYELVGACIVPSYFTEWPLVILGFIASWFYIRSIMWFPYANVRGDHSVEFSFSFNFPRLIRPYIEKVTGGFLFRLLNRIMKNRLSLRQSSEMTTLYSPGDLASASSALTALIGDPVCLEQDERSKALRDLDDRIASLSGVSTTPELASV
jgi:hypothetical protein